MPSGYYNSTGLPYNHKPPVKTRFKKGHNGYWLGKKMPPRSKEWCDKISESHKGEKNPIYGLLGKNNPKWVKDRRQLKIPDARLSRATLNLVKQCKERDGNKCRIADDNCTGRLEVHHILPYKDYPELRYKVNNCITLCHYHHPHSREDVKNLSPHFQELVKIK